MNARTYLVFAATLVAAQFTGICRAQTTYSEDFTGVTTTNQWYFFNGACLTAGTSTSLTTPGTIPSCATVWASYYNLQTDHDSYLVGGSNGYLGSSSAPASGATQQADAAGSGALRFTNGYPYGHGENGAIVSQTPFDTSQGVQITFKTVTYEGNSGGAAKDGADGISFFLMDGNQTPDLGAWGGSLGYSCSNTNTPYNGLGGAYVAVGIDEYGNFLNGANLMPGYAGTNPATGDNTAYGYGYKPNRIGMRGAGSVSWNALNAAYGTDPGSTSKPYYPASLATTCSSGTYNGTTQSCAVCSSGNYFATTNTCNSCSSGTYNASTGQCDNACALGTSESNGQYPGQCYICSNGQSHLTYHSSSNTYTCSNSGILTNTATTIVAASTAAPSSGKLDSILAVQKTCNDGNLYNYSSINAPTNAGPTTLANSANTAKILDYAPIPNAYSELPSSVQIANESVTKRGQANVIFYNLKITQDGLLSMSYSYNGGAYQPVIKDQSITDANGPLPSSFRFGFAGSTGGSTNIHEIMCFKAAPSKEAGGSTAVNEKQAAKVEAGTQAYFAVFNPNNWTGGLTANNLIDTNGNVTISSIANWDASCVLTGVESGKTCAATGVAGPTTAESPTSRVMLTWSGSAGEPFEWTGGINGSQQNTLDAGDAAPINANRLNFLRGDRSNELTSAGTGIFRMRDGVLGDIIDSSPAWVGPPSDPYTAAWSDRLNTSATMPENNGQSYVQFINANQTRLNVVYAGANDGFLHGFRAGSFDASGNFVNNASTPNDGLEVLAYMPAAALQTIHDPTNVNLDYSNPQYGHNFYVDASPGTDDLYYADKWHTWLVGGLGPGGAAIYALDITDPSSSNFKEQNAGSLVVGEWNPSTITCANVSSCGSNLGNTYGTPQIRRFHNGDWGVIFGNGFGSSTGDGGIYIMTVDQTTAAKNFYYLSTGTAAGGKAGNGIAFATPVDLDGDHIVDYIYAGDMLGNVWRFDVTNTDPTQWSAASAPLFSTPTGQPITSALLLVHSLGNGAAPQVMVEFGTGQRTQLTNTTPVTYASGTQSIYGIWDWNFSAWNSMSSSAQYASLPATGAGTGLSAPYTVSKSNLQQQTLTFSASSNTVDVSSNTVCWQGSTLCTAGSNNKFGWYADLPGTSEQIIYNPILYNGAFSVNSTVPADNVPTSCSTNLDRGYTYNVSAATGAALPNIYPNNRDVNIAAEETDATGSSYVVTTAEGTTSLVFQTVSGTPGTMRVNLPSNTKVKRLTWIERR